MTPRPLPSAGRVCVYCASSPRADPEYARVARALGRILAESGWTVVYGGGAVGSMGALAEGALAAGGHVVGVIPRFMIELEWAHTGLGELQVVEDMHERKKRMIGDVDAVAALPGGTGTFEELLEALTWKRLGLWSGPVVMLNTRDYYAPLQELLEKAIRERFMDPRHRDMWSLVERAEEVLPAIRNAPPWDAATARGFA